MTTKTEQLRKLLAEATPGPWWDEATTVEVESCLAGSRREAGLPTTEDQTMVTVDSSQVIVADCSTGLSDSSLDEVSANASLICFLRNNAALLLEIVEAAEKVGHPGFCRRNATDEQCDECDLQDAIRKWNGG